MQEGEPMIETPLTDQAVAKVNERRARTPEATLAMLDKQTAQFMAEVAELGHPLEAVAVTVEHVLAAIGFGLLNGLPHDMLLKGIVDTFAIAGAEAKQLAATVAVPTVDRPAPTPPPASEAPRVVEFSEWFEQRYGRRPFGPESA